MWLSVMRIVRGSGSHAITAPVSETYVSELVSGLLYWIRTNWDVFTSDFLLDLVQLAHQSHRSTKPNRELIAALSMSQVEVELDLWNRVHHNLLYRVFLESPSYHPFPTFLSFSSSVTVSLHLSQSHRWPWRSR